MSQSFPMRIHELVNAHHRGCLLKMSQDTDIPYTTLWRWEQGMTKQYHLDVVQKLCDYYTLDATETWEIIRRDAAKRAAGKRVPIPDLSFRKRGPARGRRTR